MMMISPNLSGSLFPPEGRENVLSWFRLRLYIHSVLCGVPYSFSPAMCQAQLSTVTYEEGLHAAVTALLRLILCEAVYPPFDWHSK